MALITVDDSRRIIEGYANTAKNAGKILESAIKARKIDKTVTKNFISTALNPLTNEVEKYRGLKLNEAYGVNSDGSKIEGIQGYLNPKSKTNVFQTLNQLEKDAKFIKESFEVQMNVMESFADATGTIQINRVITTPMMYLTYLGSSGKDKMTFQATNTKLIKRETKVKYYEINGVEYAAPGCFKDNTLMEAVLGSSVRNGLTKVNIADLVNGSVKLEKYCTIAVDGAGAITATVGADIDKELYPFGVIKYLEFDVDGAGTKKIVAAGSDIAGDTLTMNNLNRFRAKAKLVNPVTKVEGVLHADYFPGEARMEINCSAEVALTAVIVEIKTQMFNPSIQSPVRSTVRKDWINRTIEESIVQEFLYEEETKMLWHDLANIDITSEALAGFHEMTVNAKDAYVFADIRKTLQGLKNAYSVALGANAVKSSTPMAALVNGFVSSTLDFKAATDGLRFLQERQEAKFQRLVEMMSTAHLKFQQITMANGLYTNWGTNKSVVQYLTKQEASLSTEDVVAGVRPLNTVYHFEHAGNPMKVVVCEREQGWEFGQEEVEINGYPLFADENIENKVFYQFWTYTQDAESKKDYLSSLNPYIKPMMSIDNFGIVSYSEMAAGLLLKNIDI